MGEKAKGRCDLCCEEDRDIETTHGMKICDVCMDEIACIDHGRIWRWTAGQEGDSG